MRPSDAKAEEGPLARISGKERAIEAKHLCAASGLIALGGAKRRRE
jgi:hypothetical protein